MDYTKNLIMACATVIEEMLPLFPPEMSYQVFDFGLHANPDKLRYTLQAAINAVGDEIHAVILGYGLCSQAVIGIKAANCTLIVPRVDDCIAVFLGSRSAYKTQHSTEPGTYYLTKGWIEASNSPFTEYERLAQRYGQEKAEFITKVMLGNYKRLALINTGQYRLDHYREYAKEVAKRFGLSYQEIEGSNAMLKKMILGPWDDDFVIVQPGETIQFSHFFQSE